MSNKGSICADEGRKIKKKRKVMYLLEKVEVLFVSCTKEWELLRSDTIMVAKIDSLCHQEKIRLDQKRH